MKKICLSTCLVSTAVFVLSSCGPTKQITETSQQKDIVRSVTVLKENPSVKHGPYSYTYNGDKLREGNYQNNQKDGEWKAWDSEGNLSYVGNYKLGNKHGMWTYYYLESGKKRSVLFYSENIKDSLWTTYHPNGNVMSKIFYEDGKKVDTSYVYYPDGTLKSKTPYSDGEVHGTIVHYYPSGKVYRQEIFAQGERKTVVTKDPLGDVIDSGSFENGSGSIKYYDFAAVSAEDDTLKLMYSYTYVDNELDGRAKHYDRQGRLRAEGNTTKDEFKGSWLFYSEDGDVTEFTEPDSIAKRVNAIEYFDYRNVENAGSLYFVVESMPIFPGGIEELLQFISRHTEYPDNVKQNNIQGTVYASFVVDETGKVEDIEILRSVIKECDDEVVRILNILPGWVPGYQNNLPVRVQYNVPVRFILK